MLIGLIGDGYDNDVIKREQVKPLKVVLSSVV